VLRNILAGVLIAALPIILLLSPRDWFLSDQRRAVADMAAVPEGPGEILSNLPAIVAHEGVHVPRFGTKAEQIYRVLASVGQVPPPRIDFDTQRPRLGLSIREISFFGMPFGWWTEYGRVLYAEDRYELVAAPLTDEAWTRFDKEVGRDLASGWIFPFWAHGWGWLYLAGIALWVWLNHRKVLREREALGMI
jgi:hypothetical protein